MLPILIVLICIGWRVLKRKKAEEKEDEDFMTVKTRPLDPDESMKINSDDESIPYKKDLPEDSPEPTEPVRVVDNVDPGFSYGQPYDEPGLPGIGEEIPVPPGQQLSRGRQWDGETEIN